jgi:hypothetical protein
MEYEKSAIVNIKSEQLKIFRVFLPLKKVMMVITKLITIKINEILKRFLIKDVIFQY